jgi:hypothetical protein
LTNHSHLRTRPGYWWDNSVCKISSQSDEPLKSYRVNGRPDTLTDSIVYPLFEYTKRASRIFQTTIGDGSTELIKRIKNTVWIRVRKIFNPMHWKQKRCQTKPLRFRGALPYNIRHCTSARNLLKVSQSSRFRIKPFSAFVVEMIS